LPSTATTRLPGASTTPAAVP